MQRLEDGFKMNIIKAILAFFGMVITAMAGGQGKWIGGKAQRRFVAPSIATVFAFSIKLRWKYLAFLLWIPIFSIGYGVDSQLGALCFHIEWLIRLVYAILIAIPFAVMGILRLVIASILLVIAFQVQAGSIGFIPGFGDILIEDVVRYGTWALLVIVNVLTDR